MTNTHSASLGTSNSTKYLSIANSLGIDGGAITISFWVKILTEPGSGVVYQLSQQSGSATSKTTYEIYYQNNAGTLQLGFQRCKACVSCTAVGNYNVTLGTANWHLIVATYDATNLRLYLDGSLVSGPTAASGTGSCTPTTGFYLGCNDGNANLASSLFDDVRVFNTARAAATIATDYSAPAELFGNEANLVAYYTFDSSLTADLTANAYNLTNTGTVTQSADVPFTGLATTNASFLLMMM